jgi:hypothetical protein
MSGKDATPRQPGTAEVELLIARVEEMREAQKEFFENRMKSSLGLAKDKERAVDEIIRQFRTAGYNPDKFKTKVEQSRMFG